MKRAVRTVIRLIAAGIIVFGGLNLALEFARFRQHRADFSSGRCVVDSLVIVLGVILAAASGKLAARLTDDFDE